MRVERLAPGEDDRRPDQRYDERPWVAVGDVHGCADLLGAMLDAIERDLIAPRVVLLGDLVDRGPDVRGALALAREVPTRFPGSTVLRGNHEDWMLRAVAGNEEAREDWLTWGGEATCSAFGVDTWHDRHRLADAFAPFADDLDAMRARPLRLDGFGAAAGHLFVHAGVDPTRALDDQHERDLIWMREPFLSWPHPLARRVVHGHTISQWPEERAHRIGVDTGAYGTGMLSAVVLEAGAPPRYLAAFDTGPGGVVDTRADRA